MAAVPVRPAVGARASASSAARPASATPAPAPARAPDTAAGAPRRPRPAIKRGRQQRARVTDRTRHEYLRKAIVQAAPRGTQVVFNA